MAAEDGRPYPDLTQHPLFKEPHRYSFVQAVRLLEGLLEDREPIGHDRAPSEETVRFAASASLAFPTSTIAGLSQARDQQPVMTIAFMGLTGPSGVLPLFYTEFLLDEKDNNLRGRGEGALSAFLGMFHHRLTSLAYRAWERNHPFLSVNPKVRAQFAEYLLSLIGFGLPSTREGLGFPVEALISRGAWFADRRRSPAGVLALVRDLLGEWSRGADLRLMPGLDDVGIIPDRGRNRIIVAEVDRKLHFRVFDRDARMVVDAGEDGLANRAQQIQRLKEQLEGLWPPADLAEDEEGRIVAAIRSIVGRVQFGPPDVEVESFVGRWLDLGESGRSRIGTGPGGRNRKLGEDAVIGSEVRDFHGKFRVKIGPLGWGSFRDLESPDSPAFQRLARLISLYAGPEWDYDIELILRRDSVPSCRLGSARLGRVAWLGPGPSSEDRSVIIKADLRSASR